MTQVESFAPTGLMLPLPCALKHIFAFKQICHFQQRPAFRNLELKNVITVVIVIHYWLHSSSAISHPFYSRLASVEFSSSIHGFGYREIVIVIPWFVLLTFESVDYAGGCVCVGGSHSANMVITLELVNEREHNPWARGFSPPHAPIFTWAG